MISLLLFLSSLYVSISFCFALFAAACGECVHGTCADGTCVCKAGFYGDGCKLGSGICVEATQEGCFHGTCKAGECLCEAGYYGDRCDQKGCSNHCNFNGLCYEPAGEPAQCLCLYGHFGPSCAESGCAKGCRHGTCLMARSGLIHCQCEPGWAGDDCGTRVCDPCQNGSCDGVQCICEEGWTGIDCSQRVCPPCGDRGTCDPTSGQCICKPGFFNRAMARPDCTGTELHCPDRCTDPTQGVCLATGCKCFDGWAGADCSQMKCKNDCSGRGSCRQGQCYCNAGFTGADCSEPVCPNQCSGRGLCVGGNCHCLSFGASQLLASLPHAAPEVAQALVPAAPPASLLEVELGLAPSAADTAFAASVQTTIALPAGLRPSLAPIFFPSLPLAVVDPGFAGADCALRACATDCGAPQNRGACDTVTGVCVCAQGFYWKTQGQDCSLALCTTERDCSGHGLCVDGACRCLDGYSGANCESAAASLPPAAQSLLEQSSAASALRAANTARAEAAARAEHARQQLLAALHAAEQQELSQALAAVRADRAAMAELDAAGETDPGIRALYTEKLASRAQAFKHVLALHESLLETDPVTAVAAPAAAAAAPGAPTAAPAPADSVVSSTAPTAAGVVDAETLAAQARFGREMQASRAVSEAVRRAEEALASAGKGCTAECSHRGVCVDGKCRCKDSHGAYCEHLSCPAGCSGRGVCDPASGKCACAEGFGGPDCGRADCAPRDCSGHGTCVPEERRDGSGALLATLPVCKCAKGWTGPRCDVATCAKTCSHRGVCAGHNTTVAADGAVTVTEGQCFCFPGFAGANCELGPTCEHDCGLHGKCVAHVDGSKGAVAVGCACAAGYTGPQCRQRVCTEQEEAQCGPNGVCADGKCLCEPGFEGERCDRRNDCEPACDAKHGFCGAGPNGKGKCHCEKGFGGASCQGKLCDKGCMGRGLCLDGACQCRDAWFGTDCEKGCPDDCTGRGACVEDDQGRPQCLCKAPFTGPACKVGMCPGAELTPEGKQVSCRGHGQCDSANAQCQCDLGYVAPDCGVFTRAECSRSCRVRCRDGEGGAFPVVNQLTNLTEVLTAAQCVRHCEAKCALVDPVAVEAAAKAAAEAAAKVAAAEAAAKAAEADAAAKAAAAAKATTTPAAAASASAAPAAAAATAAAAAIAAAGKPQK